RLQDARVAIPAVAGTGADFGTFVAIDISGGEPGSAPLFVHVDAVVVVGEFEWIAMLARIGPDLSGVLLHRLGGELGKRNSDSVEEVGIVARTRAVILVDDNGLFCRFGFGRGRGGNRDALLGA